MFKYASASIALLALSNPALINAAWAAGCASPEEASALKTAVLQQELMVAALQCHESGAYNRFVTTFRPELQSSDASLKAFFVRRGGEHGEAGYDTFKTKAANLSALEQARDAHAFCGDAHALFQAALTYRGSLMSFVNSRPGAADIANICIESRPRPQIAAAPAPIKVAVTPAAAAVAVAGVPDHSQPSIPTQQENMGAPPQDQSPQTDQANAARDRALEDREAARNDEENDAAQGYAADDSAPPPRPRYYRVRRYDPYVYTSRAYSPTWQYYYGNSPAAPYSYWYRRGYYNW